MRNLCGSTSTLEKFLSYIDSALLEFSTNSVTIHSGTGPVEWVYLEIFNMWAVDGDFMHCIVTAGTLT